MDWLRVENKLDNEIEVNITGLIGGGMFSDGVTADKVQNDIINLSNELGKTPSKIVVNILNSPGGSVFHATAIHDLLQIHKSRVVTNGIGLVASAATIIHQAGGKGNRFLSPNSRYLVHRIQGVVEGTPEEIEQQNEEMKGLEQGLVSIYTATNTANKSATEIFKKMKVNNGMGEFMTADEAIENGYADGKIKTYKVAACINVDEVTAKLCKIPTLEIKNQIDMENTFMELLKNDIADIKNSISKFLNPEKPVETPEKVDLTEITNKITEVENKLNEVVAENATLTGQISEKETALTAATEQVTNIQKEFAAFAQANAHTVTFNEAEIVIEPHAGKPTEEDVKTKESVNTVKDMFKIKQSGVNIKSE